jgi:hypothetical protein
VQVDAFTSQVLIGLLVCRMQADRQANAFFDGVLPPFSNVGNTGRGNIG